MILKRVKNLLENFFRKENSPNTVPLGLVSLLLTLPVGLFLIHNQQILKKRAEDWGVEAADSEETDPDRYQCIDDSTKDGCATSVKAREYLSYKQWFEKFQQAGGLEGGLADPRWPYPTGIRDSTQNKGDLEWLWEEKIVKEAAEIVNWNENGEPFLDFMVRITVRVPERVHFVDGPGIYLCVLGEESGGPDVLPEEIRRTKCPSMLGNWKYIGRERGGGETGYDHATYVNPPTYHSQTSPDFLKWKPDGAGGGSFVIPFLYNCGAGTGDLQEPWRCEKALEDYEVVRITPGGTSPPATECLQGGETPCITRAEIDLDGVWYPLPLSSDQADLLEEVGPITKLWSPESGYNKYVYKFRYLVDSGGTKEDFKYIIGKGSHYTCNAVKEGNNMTRWYPATEDWFTGTCHLTKNALPDVVLLEGTYHRNGEVVHHLYNYPLVEGVEEQRYPPPSTTTPTSPPSASPSPPANCPRFSQGDADCDGEVTPLDYAIWLDAYLNGVGNADFNGKNGTDPADYVRWLNNYLREN